MKENNELKGRIQKLEDQINSLSPTKKSKLNDTDKSLKELMEVRLEETLGEAKRHYQSYVDIREQYNSFVNGRINQMFKHVIENGMSPAQKKGTSPNPAQSPMN
jgi:uncharacterized protein (DUF3084 family)